MIDSNLIQIIELLKELKAIGLAQIIFLTIIAAFICFGWGYKK